MPWPVKNLINVRLEFVNLAKQPEINLRELCRRFGISPTVGYKWLARYKAQGAAGLQDRSRRPHQSPTRTDAAVEGYAGLSIACWTNVYCRVEYRTNLAPQGNWITLSNLVKLTNHPTLFIDRASSNSPQRFYRVVTPFIL